MVGGEAVKLGERAFPAVMRCLLPKCPPHLEKVIRPSMSLKKEGAMRKAHRPSPFLEMNSFLVNDF